ncbi:unnamed protein product [Thelazia callipaeda]|uniref:Secreted protein n=1 Tax=Thelazia callipaeda TaxID=103827 RepID=A0A0N5D5B3_THECL|nr:unnamed protein product [Thelazia callipaeda]
MSTFSVLTTFFVTVLGDSLVLYYPVYPNFVVPKHLQNFERNAPPRIFPRDPDIPSSGIVFLRKDLPAKFKINKDRTSNTNSEKETNTIKNDTFLTNKKDTDEAKFSISQQMSSTEGSLQENTLVSNDVTSEIDYTEYDASEGSSKRATQSSTTNNIIGSVKIQVFESEPEYLFAQLSTIK